MIKFLSLIMAVVGALGAGCDGKCSGAHNCPNDSASTVIMPSGLTSPLVEVSADAPCEASFFGGDGGNELFVQVTRVPTQTTTCHLHGRTASGAVVAATVTFQIMSGCCQTFSATVSDFTLADAGADGP